MFDKFPSRGKNTKPTGLETIDFKHVIPADWGTLRISTQAEKDYGLVPLVPTASSAPERPKKNKHSFPDLNIYIASFDEANEIESNTQMRTTSQDSSGIHIAICPDSSADELSVMSDQAIDTMLLLQGVSPDDVERMKQEIRDKDGISIKERIAHELPSEVAHSAASAAAQGAGFVAHEWLDSMNDKRHLQITAGIGAIGVAGTGAYMAILEYIGDGSYSLIPSLGIIGVTTYRVHSEQKRYLGETHTRQQTHIAAAEQLANLVYGTVHETFCREHFDKKLKEQTGEL